MELKRLAVICEELEPLRTRLDMGALGPEISEKLLVSDEAAPFAALLLGLALLEARLFDLHARLPELPDTRAPAILKELLQSPQLSSALPPGASEWLYMVFHPRCLALRNLSWHGFLSPDSVQPALASLALSLWEGVDGILEQQAPADPRRQRSYWDAHSVDSVLSDAPSLAAVSAEAADSLVALITAWAPPGSASAVALSWRLFGEGLPAAGCCLLLPLLEHALRLRFSLLNGLEDCKQATPFEFYVTLDGFGQRRTHLLLLQPLIPASDVPGAEAAKLNALLAELGPGASALLTDLFMAAGGPSLRGKLCHGSVRLLEPESGQPAACYRALFAAVIALAHWHDSSAPLSSEALAVADQCEAFVSGYAPRFIPAARLEAAFAAGIATLQGLEALSDRFELRCVETEVAIWDGGVFLCTASRGGSNGMAAAASELRNSLTELCRSIGGAGRMRQVALSELLADGLAPQQGEAPGAQPAATEVPPFGEHTAVHSPQGGDSGGEQEALEALVAACEMPTVAAVALQAMADSLAQDARARRARTSHRRRLLGIVEASKTIRLVLLQILLLADLCCEAEVPPLPLVQRLHAHAGSTAKLISEGDYAEAVQRAAALGRSRVLRSALPVGQKKRGHHARPSQ